MGLNIHSKEISKEPSYVLKPGHLLQNRYKIEQFLEVKHGANLYRAFDEITKLIVIVKEKLSIEKKDRKTSIILKDNKENSLLNNPWYDEFAILRSVSYPTVVKAVDIFQENDRSYLIIEQLEGRDLGFFLTREKVSVQQSCDWMIQLCQSISQLHRKKIVHLDLQPRYIVVTYDKQRVRLTGFSRAQQLPVLTPISDITQGYSAPELYEDSEWDIDERADIYSLGVIWYQLLTGNDPTKQFITSKFDFPELNYYLPNINPQLDRIVSTAIKKQPRHRFNSIDEMKIAILELMANSPIHSGYCTDVGVVREANEDSYFVQEWNYVSQTSKNSYGIFIVADGMGGAKAGELASALATKETANVINKHFEKLQEKEDIDVGNIFEIGIKKANSIIYNTAKRNPEYSGMGTTITGVIIYKGQAYFGHVGDSRAYLINNDGIDKITRDHSLVGRLLELGQITEEEAEVHPQRNLIYRSLGSYPNVEVDLYQRQFRPGDRILLCSDGLLEHVKDDEIYQIVKESNNLTSACHHLINLANIRGGEDNTTIIIIEMEPIN